VKYSLHFIADLFVNAVSSLIKTAGLREKARSAG